MKKRKLGKLGISSLIKEFELLDEKQIISTVGGSYYYDKDTGAFFGITETGNDVRFIDSDQWSYVASHDIADAGYLFSEIPDNFSAKAAVLRSFLPAGAQNIGIVNSSSSSAIAGFEYNNITGSLTFGYDPFSAYWDDYTNMVNIMYHESYHWNNGHVPGTSGYSGYGPNEEIETIMAQIGGPDYQSTTDDFKIRTGESLYTQWEELGIQDTSGHTINDAYRIANVNGYSS
jgi:hypothetical protein